MDSETTSIEHTLAGIRRLIQEEFPDLNLNFIIAKKGEVRKVLERKRAELEQQPAGAQMLQALFKTNPEETFCVIAKAKEKKLISFLAHDKTLACVVVIADGSLSDIDRLKQRAYAMAWHVLNIFANPQSEHKPDKDGIINLVYKEEMDYAWHNMLADTFSALVLEIQGKKGSIRTLAKRRSMMALESLSTYTAEHYPYPIVMDAAQLVYTEARKEGTLQRSTPFTQALEMTGEIGLTFDQNTVVQWWAFAKPAQEMAWLKVEKNKILGAAVHSSEEPYARATAYLVSETLAIEPSALSELFIYNAFADVEINERHHRKVCDDLFQDLIGKAEMQKKSDPLRIEAAKLNQNLVQGLVVGWCAPALIAAADAFDSAPDKDGQNIEAAKKAFAQTDRTFTGEVLRKLAQILVAVRREVSAPAPEHLAATLRDDPELRGFANALLIHPQTGR